MLSFTATLPRSGCDEPLLSTLLLLRECHQRCFALLHTATPPPLEVSLAASHSDSSSKLVASSLIHVIGCRDAVSQLTPELHSTCISSRSSGNVCFPESTPHGRVEPPCRICSRCSRRHQTALSRWLPRRSGKTSALRRTFHSARRSEIVRRCSRALALLASATASHSHNVSIHPIRGLSVWRCDRPSVRWSAFSRPRPLGVPSLADSLNSSSMVAVCRCDRARLSRGCNFCASAPCLARQAIAPAERHRASSPRSLFSHACLVSCAAGQSALPLLFVLMLALTLASSTPAPFPRSLFETLVTSRRRVLDRRRRDALSQGLLVRRFHLGSSCSSVHEV